MRKILFSAILATAAFAAQPAAAVVTFDSAGDTSGTINFNGIVNGAVQPGLTSSLSLTLNSIVNGVFTFGYSLTNTSSAPITASRVSGFGFNSTPNAQATGNSVTGTFSNVTLNGNVPQLGQFDICVSNVNCAGGASGGVLFGQTGTGTLTLNFGAGTTSITLDDFYVRYQSIVGATGGDSGSGSPIPPIPEPATWMMIVGGFGALGSIMRRRGNMKVSFA